MKDERRDIYADKFTEICKIFWLSLGFVFAIGLGLTILAKTLFL